MSGLPAPAAPDSRHGRCRMLGRHGALPHNSGGLGQREKSCRRAFIIVVPDGPVAVRTSRSETTVADEHSFDGQMLDDRKNDTTRLRDQRQHLAPHGVVEALDKIGAVVGGGAISSRSRAISGRSRASLGRPDQNAKPPRPAPARSTPAGCAIVVECPGRSGTRPRIAGERSRRKKPPCRGRPLRGVPEAQEL